MIVELIPDSGGRVLNIQGMQRPQLLFKHRDVPGWRIHYTTAGSRAEHMDTVQGADRVHLGKAAITSLKEGFNPTQAPTAGCLMAQGVLPKPRCLGALAPWHSFAPGIRTGVKQAVETSALLGGRL